jgi:hypothetical protein
VLGTGSIINGAVSITGWTPGDGVLDPMVGRNVWVTITSAADIGRTFITKVTSAGASLGISQRSHADRVIGLCRTPGSRSNWRLKEKGYKSRIH